MENERNRIRLEIFKKYDTKIIVKGQSNLTFKEIHKSYENCDSFTFKQNEFLVDKTII